MGISGMETKIRESEDCVIDVNIAQLVEEDGRNVIVVDGFHFYGLYLYPKFDWVCGGLHDLVREVGKFVHAFQRIGVKLVFFFAEGDLDQYLNSFDIESWVKRRSTFIEQAKQILRQLSRRSELSSILKHREYTFTPLNALPVVIYALSHMFHCEVHLVYAGDRKDSAAYYVRNNNCFALLAQDTMYLFYQHVPRYLSLGKLNLEHMTTIQYFTDVIANKWGVEGHFYPVFIQCPLNPPLRELLIQINQKLKSENVDVARMKIMKCLKTKDINVLDLGDEDVDNKVKIEGKDNEEIMKFLYDVMRYNFGFQYMTAEGPVTKWELIKLKAQELYASGQMSSKIEKILMYKMYFNDCILENFVAMPPSSLIYRPLRQKLYGILLHEAADIHTENEINEVQVQWQGGNTDDSDLIVLQPGALRLWEKKNYDIDFEKLDNDAKVDEWIMTQDGCFKDHNPVIPHVVDPNLHPGLLVLWDPVKNTSDIQHMKWQLFTKHVSSGLDCELLRTLPPTLVIPTTVLYYLYNEVPLIFKNQTFFQQWEVEVFIAQSVMRSKVAEIPNIFGRRINSRVVMLNAIFVYGCHTMSLLVEACGYPISEKDLSLWHFFDGQLLHSFYEKAEWRRSALHLCARDSLATFQQMKQIILPEISTSSRRM